MRGRYAVFLAAVSTAAAIMAVPALAAAESMSAHVTTANPTVGKDLDIAGQVTGAASYPVTVMATRDDSSGNGTPVGMPVMSDDQGNFTVQDTPPARGSVTYHLSADTGAAMTDVTTTVAGKPTDLVIHVQPAPARAEHTVTVTAQLRSMSTNRELTLYFRPYQGSKQQFDQGPVDANGNRTADHVVHRRTTFIAVFAGDSAYAPATAATTVAVSPVLDEQLKGWYRSSGDTKIYHHRHNPSLAVHMLPEHKGNCLHFRAQHRSHGEWVRSAVSTCVRTDATGRAIGVLTGDHIVGVRYRLRAEWNGTTALRHDNGRWLYLEFR